MKGTGVCMRAVLLLLVTAAGIGCGSGTRQGSDGDAGQIDALQTDTITCDLLACGLSCIDPTTDVENCGACGRVCTAPANATATCVSGSCSYTCVEGYADCDADAGNGCEVLVIGDDAANCGNCRRGCCGGTCQGGTCQPVVLAASQGQVYGIAVDATSVYWITHGANSSTPAVTVMKVPLDGGETIPLLPAPQWGSKAWGMALDATSVYWANQSPAAIMKVSIAGGPPVTVTSLTYVPMAIAVDATAAYWSGSGLVAKVALDGGTPVTLASGQAGSTNLALDATNIYWTGGPDGQSVMTVPTAGGTPAILVSGYAWPGNIAVDHTSVYWDYGLVPTIMKMPLGGGTPVTLITGQYPTAIAVDAAFLYWIDVRDTVMKLPLAGGDPITLASGQNSPTAIALDADCVYWSNGGSGVDDGSVMKLAK